MKFKHLHYGWVTVGIATCTLATISITIYTFGVFVIPMTTEFAWDRGALSGAYSMFWLISGLLGIFAGKRIYPNGNRGFKAPSIGKTIPARLLSLLGKYALPLYLLHQPVIVAVLFLLYGLPA